MIALALPLAIELPLLAVVGACLGALANCVLFACMNVVHLTNPWAPIEEPRGRDKLEQKNQKPHDFAPRTTADRIPIIGWLLLRRESSQRSCCFWVCPLLLEVAFAIALPLLVWWNPATFFADLYALWDGWPLGLQYFLLACDGLLAGALTNYVIYTQAFSPRPIDPWSPKHDDAPPRSWTDRIPVIGWLGLRRESSIHGNGFWVRPLLIELSLATALPALYWYETQAGGIFPVVARQDAILSVFQPWTMDIFVGHGILLVLMTAATFIDFDEKTIPDVITLPGTIIGLVLSAMIVPIGTKSLNGFMPTALPVCQEVEQVIPTTFDSPWFEQYVGSKWEGSTGLWTGLAIWTVFCFAYADRRFTGVMLRRRGLSKTIEFFFAALFHHWTWKLLAVLWMVGLVAVSTVWSVGGESWRGLLSGLVGLAVGGGTIWAIRIVGSAAMQREAMGFGDVTLMAMVGAFIGWQGSLAAFFLSPFAAIAIVTLRWVVTRDTQVPFGPYLCAGTMLTILFWDRVYNQALACNFYLLGTIVIWVAVAMLGLMGVMLFALQLIKSLVRGRSR